HGMQHPALGVEPAGARARPEADRGAARRLRYGELQPHLQLAPRGCRPSPRHEPRRLRRKAGQARDRALGALRHHERGGGGAAAALSQSLIGLARISINAFKGMTGVRELERLVREEGFKALGVSALVDMIPASDRRYYPLYTKAAELGIPV